MRNVLILLGLLVGGLAFVWKPVQESVEKPLIITPEIATPVVVEPTTPTVGQDEPVQSTSDTAAKAEVQSLTWQIEIMREQLEKAQAELDDNASMELEPPSDIVQPSPVYQSAPRGHYEYRRQGLFRRKKVWVTE